MNANELRIGNLIQVEAFKPATTEYATVFSISEDEINCRDSRGSTLITSLGLTVKEYGIPLTPEWLERMWFSKIQGIWYGLGKISCHFDSIGSLSVYLGDWGEDFIYIKSLTTVHDLQNFAFINTGKELEIKP